MCARFTKMGSVSEESGPDCASIKSSAAVHVNISHRRKDLGSAGILCPLAVLGSQVQVYTAPCPLLTQGIILFILTSSVTCCGQESVIP